MKDSMVIAEAPEPSLSVFIVCLIVRILNSALNKQLKRIQIAEKMHGLKEKKNALPD